MWDGEVGRIWGQCDIFVDSMPQSATMIKSILNKQSISAIDLARPASLKTEPPVWKTSQVVVGTTGSLMYVHCRVGKLAVRVRSPTTWFDGLITPGHTAGGNNITVGTCWERSPSSVAGLSTGTGWIDRQNKCINYWSCAKRIGAQLV